MKNFHDFRHNFYYELLYDVFSPKTKPKSRMIYECHNQNQLVKLFIILIPILIILLFGLQNTFAENYESFSVGDGIRLAYSPHFDLNGLRLALIVDREINLVQIDFNPYSFNQTKSGTIAFILPYQGTLEKSTGWEMKSFERNTIFVKHYQCSELEPCFAFPREFINFQVDGKIDTKKLSHHIVNFEIQNSSPSSTEEYDYILSFRDDREHFELGFTEIKNGKAILIIENTAYNLKENPTAKYDRFGNTGTGYENKQFVWDISKIGYVAAEYDVDVEPDISPTDFLVMEPEVKEAVGIVWSDYILPIILGIIGTLLGAYLWYNFSRHLKGNLKIDLVKFRTYDFHGMNICRISGRISSSYERVLNDVDVTVEVKKDNKLIKMKSFTHNRDRQGEKNDEKLIEWETKGVDWFTDSTLENSQRKLEQIRTEDELFFKFPGHGIWFGTVGTGTSTTYSSDYGIDVESGKRYAVTIRVRGTDQDGHTKIANFSKHIKFSP